ncbi:hypothetical protein DRO03_10290 [Methanosarcinales archaeon]|nr:MAG: hypothetical protein DRO03_10290 [Methanosarcinales archaeon]
MTILTQGDSIKSQYDDLQVTRAIDNKIAKVRMDRKLPSKYPLEVLSLLVVLTNLANEDFKALADFQKRRA